MTSGVLNVLFGLDQQLIGFSSEGYDCPPQGNRNRKSILTIKGFLSEIPTVTKHRENVLRKRHKPREKIIARGSGRFLSLLFSLINKTIETWPPDPALQQSFLETNHQSLWGNLVPARITL